MTVFADSAFSKGMTMRDLIEKHPAPWALCYGVVVDANKRIVYGLHKTEMELAFDHVLGAWICNMVNAAYLPAKKEDEHGV